MAARADASIKSGGLTHREIVVETGGAFVTGLWQGGIPAFALLAGHRTDPTRARAGVALSGASRQLLHCQPEERARPDKGPVLEARDQPRPRVLRAGCDIAPLGSRGRLQCAARQAGQEVFR